jgi:hypothetical protein
MKHWPMGAACLALPGVAARPVQEAASERSASSRWPRRARRI